MKLKMPALFDLTGRVATRSLAQDPRVFVWLLFFPSAQSFCSRFTI
jgi:hypothetical protein